jgi:hypothetical protein
VAPSRRSRIVGFDGQVELEALRLYGLRDVAPELHLAAGGSDTRSVALERRPHAAR